MSYTKKPCKLIGTLGSSTPKDFFPFLFGSEDEEGDLPFGAVHDQEYARRIVACMNACSGSSTDWLEFIVSDECSDEFGGPMPFETRHGEILRMSLGFMVERDQLKKQRDELLSVMRLVASEVTDGVRPTSADSHLPADIVAVVHAAIAKAVQP